MRQVAKTLLSSDGKRRVQIYQRDDGVFSFAEASYSIDWQGKPIWVELMPYSSFSDTAETAEREARATIEWLRELPHGDSTA